MKIETETLADHQARLTVTLDHDRLESAKKQAARKISRNTKIPGFRPGKAPYPVVARTVGDAALIEEALEILVDNVYPEVIEQAGVEPYGPGTLDNVESMDPPVFEFRVPLAPVVNLGDYQEIRIPYKPPRPSDHEVKKVLDDLRERQAVIEHVDRPAEAGDIVYITLSGMESSTEGEGDSNQILAERKMNILIRTEEEGSQTDEWPFSGFNQDLIMTSAGDVHEVEYDFPDDDESGEFRGKSVLFQAVIDEVVSRELPELDDDFAQSVGEFETAEALTEYVAESLQESAMREYEDEYHQKILDRMVEISTVEFPPQMVEHELEHMIERFERQIAGMGMDLDVYMKTRDMTMEDLETEMRPDAERRIRRSLVLLEYVSQADLEVNPEEVQDELQQTIRLLDQSTAGQPGKPRPSYSREALESQLLNRHLERAAFVRLKAIASGELEASSAASETQDPAGPDDPQASPQDVDDATEEDKPKAKGKKTTAKSGKAKPKEAQPEVLAAEDQSAATE